MKRHPALVPLSHDHHHALVEARRLRRASRTSGGERLATARSFLRFFARETVHHFREEEEIVFPLLLTGGAPAPELLVAALVEHQRIHGHAAALRSETAKDEVAADRLVELGELLDVHIRLEERQLFPLLERELDEEVLSAIVLDGAPAPGPEAAVPATALDAASGPGPVWGAASDDLNATLLAWPPGHRIAEHVNAERDVLYVAVAGGGTLTIDGAARPLEAPSAVLVPKGAARALVAGDAGLRYLTAHLRRPGLQLQQL